MSRPLIGPLFFHLRIFHRVLTTAKLYYDTTVLYCCTVASFGPFYHYTKRSAPKDHIKGKQSQKEKLCVSDLFTFPYHITLATKQTKRFDSWVPLLFLTTPCLKCMAGRHPSTQRNSPRASMSTAGLSSQ